MVGRERALGISGAGKAGRGNDAAGLNQGEGTKGSVPGKVRAGNDSLYACEGEALLWRLAVGCPSEGVASASMRFLCSLYAPVPARGAPGAGETERSKTDGGMDLDCSNKAADEVSQAQ